MGIAAFDAFQCCSAVTTRKKAILCRTNLVLKVPEVLSIALQFALAEKDSLCGVLPPAFCSPSQQAYLASQRRLKCMVISMLDVIVASPELFQKAGNLVMFKHAIALALGAFVAIVVSPAVAQTPPTTSAGTLTCKMAPSIGLIFGSRQKMACRFIPVGNYPPEAYLGVMGTIGLDIGITAGGVMAWGVLAPTAGPMRGKLAGTYVGASGAVGVGVGVGANLLFGGSNRSIALQPLSVEGSVGINLSVGVSSLTLTLAQ